MDFESQLDQVLEDLREMLLAKNRAYGNSALRPVRVFSKAGPVEQIKVRIDDKISRLLRGDAAGEDTVTDLLGYLVILKIAERTSHETENGLRDSHSGVSTIQAAQ